MKSVVILSYIIILILEYDFLNCEIRTSYHDSLLLKNEKVCQSMAVTKPQHLRQLENCTVIEGHLYIFMLRLLTNPSRKYPLLKEITESLFVYHVKGIRNLGVYFPNLSVIRGQSLTYNYALVIKGTSLRNVGLSNLRVILAGGVRIDTNSLLCYISSVDWKLLVKEVGAPIKIINSRTMCPDFCPKNCSTNGLMTNNVALCWSQKECQHVCSPRCSNIGLSCAMNNLDQCCNPQCLAGCYGPEDYQCVACRNVMYNGRCVAECDNGYYKHKGRRCISEEECLAKTYPLSSTTNVIQQFAIEGDSCVKQCSLGKDRDKLTGRCIDCGEECHPKSCYKVFIQSVSDLKQVDGCYSVKELLINIKEGGEILSISLERYFAKLTVIEDYIRISKSSSITSLDFLKSLKEIRGSAYKNNQPAGHSMPVVFDVYGNDNLVHIWRNKSIEKQSRIKILFGSISIKLNPKLCPDKITRFLEHNIVLNYNLPAIDQRIMNVSNGDMAYCNDERLSIELVSVTNSSVTAVCRSKIKSSNLHDRSTSALFMIKTSRRDLSPYELFNNCYDHGWRIIEGQLGKEQYIDHLNPATRYVIYVEAIRSRVDNWLEISDFLYFTTNVTYPSPPLKLKAESINSSKIKVSWRPPFYPNGNITKYFIWYQKLDIIKEDFVYNEPCSDKSLRNHPKIRSSQSKDDTIDANNSANSECNCNNCMSFCVDDKQLLLDSSDDFGFHMTMYHSTHLLHSRVGELIHNLTHLDIDTHTEDHNMVDHLYHNTSLRNLSLMYSKHQNVYFRSVSAEFNSYMFENLHHYSEYLFEIQACQESPDNHVYNPYVKSHPYKGYLCSERSYINGHTLPKDGADNINLSGVVMSPNGNNIVIKWYEPERPNGLIMYFIIRYKEVSADKQIWSEKCVSRWDWLNKEEFGINNDTKKFGDNSRNRVAYSGEKETRYLLPFGGVRLSNLRVGKYEFQIKCISTADDSSWSKSIEFSIVSGSFVESHKEVFIIGCVFVPIFISLAIWITYHYYRKKYLAGKRWVSSNPDYWIIYEIDEWEIKREDVDMIGWNYALGRGSFGLVYKGILKNLTTPAKERIEFKENLENIYVAVKTLNSSSTVSERREFINEACYMKQFQSNHLVMLFGIVSKIEYSHTNKESSMLKRFFGRIQIFGKMKRRFSETFACVRRRLNIVSSKSKAAVGNELEILKSSIQKHFQKMPLVVMELMENGDLAGYLRRQGEDGDGLVSDNQAYLWALQIADGMLYLSDRKFIHRDLATRNCMVNANIVVKIGDFGMARDVYYDCYYRKKGTGRLPVRWMAPEALRSAYFTVASDIWSYGVVLWEIVTLASMPFRGMSHHDVIQFVTNGGNLLTNSPQLTCSKLLLNLMQLCWKTEPHNRPTFHEIINLTKEFADTNFFNNSYYFEKEAQSTISVEDLSTDIISNYSKGNVEQCEEII